MSYVPNSPIKEINEAEKQTPFTQTHRRMKPRRETSKAEKQRAHKMLHQLKSTNSF